MSVLLLLPNDLPSLSPADDTANQPLERLGVGQIPRSVFLSH